MADFILMLTRRDVTVPDCLELFHSLKDLGLAHVGFKDVGADAATLKRLTAAIRQSGAKSYVEVVSTTPATIAASIEAAAVLGVDRVLGGKDIAAAQRVVYYPFAGSPIGHPTALGGTADEIEADCAAARRGGCPGVDLLAYRSIDEEPVKLIKAARRGLGRDGYLIVAGSIDSPARIAETVAAGADAFTIGSALFDESFAPGVKGLRGQCEAVLRAIGR